MSLIAAPPPPTESRSQLARIVIVLAGAVAVFSTNTYLTTSLLPSVLADIGGERYYAWTATAFLVASVFTSMLVSRLLLRLGTRDAMTLGVTVFGVGSLICVLSPSIWVLLAGRLIQGLGGGLMSGLGLTVMRLALPEQMWPRTLAVISAMWGVGNLTGPSLGGAFAQIGQWRLGFLAMALAAAALVLLSVLGLPRERGDSGAEPVPAASLALLTAAATAVSVAGIVPKGWPTALVLVAGTALAVVFLARERVARGTRILPALTFRRDSSLRWCYLGVAGLTVGLTTETFVPLFGQRLGGLSPLLAGFLGAAFSAGWSVAQFAAAGFSGERATRVLRLGGPIVLVVGLAATTLLQRSHPSGVLVGAWAVTLMIAGSGIGVGYSRFAFAAMGSTADVEEASKASAGLNIVQVITTAFGSALGGVLVNLGEPSIVRSAQLLYGGVAVLALAGVAAAVHLRRREAVRVPAPVAPVAEEAACA